jgi:hypothetical protein
MSLREGGLSEVEPPVKQMLGKHLYFSCETDILAKKGEPLLSALLRKTAADHPRK